MCLYPRHPLLCANARCCAALWHSSTWSELQILQCCNVCIYSVQAFCRNTSAWFVCLGPTSSIEKWQWSMTVWQRKWRTWEQLQGWSRDSSVCFGFNLKSCLLEWKPECPPVTESVLHLSISYLCHFIKTSRSSRPFAAELKYTRPDQSKQGKCTHRLYMCTYIYIYGYGYCTTAIIYKYATAETPHTDCMHCMHCHCQLN